jgi:hypothetical protein
MNKTAAASTSRGAVTHPARHGPAPSLRRAFLRRV